MEPNQTKTAVLFLNLGGPERLDEVRPFLFRLFRDPDILPLPKWLRWLAWPLAWLISTMRAPKSRKAYLAIGGGSPLLKTNREVVAKLIKRYQNRNQPLHFAIAMRYWHPLTHVALTELKQQGIEQILVLPMYPQYSTTTTMSSYRALYRYLKKEKHWQPTLRIILDYHQDERYLQLVQKRIDLELAKIPRDQYTQTAVLYSAHSIPLDRVHEEKDPYPQQIEAFCQWLSRRLDPTIRTELAYQSKVGPVAWLGPATPDAIAKLAHAGIKNIVIVPVSFVSEHVETLEEIEQEYGELAKHLGIVNFLRVPTVCADDDFIDFLDQLITQQLQQGFLPTQQAPKNCLRGMPDEVCVCKVYPKLCS